LWFLAVLGCEKQSQSKPICRLSAGNPKHEDRNPKQDGKVLNDRYDSMFEKTKPISRGVGCREIGIISLNL
jgi:hypothetical protein